MKDKEFIRWTKYRKIGQLKFTFLWMLYFIVMINVIVYVGDTIKNRFVFDIGDFLIRIIISGAFGIFSGTMMWKSNERGYKDYLNKKYLNSNT